MSLANKVAIVTGGNSGIGKAVALELARQGASVVIDYVSHPEATDALETQITALGASVIGVQADVSKLDDLQRLFASAVEKFGHVDIMVNNAGVETRTSILDTTEDQYDKVLEHQFKERVFRHPAGGQTDDQAGRRRPDHQHDFDSRRLADARQHGVLSFQRRYAHVDAHGGGGTCSP